MKTRIERVCRGHMRWLFTTPKKLPRENAFCPNMWVSGQNIREWENNEYLPGKSLVDTALQVIKAGEFYKTFKENDHLTSIDTIVKNWIEDIDETTRWGHYMFPHYDSEPTKSFHLTDHALIWQAIKSAEDMGIRPKPEFADRDYSSNFLRQAMMRGFTVQPPGLPSKQPMIAVTRSLSLDRFTLKPQDTALFSAMESGFFNECQTGDKFGQWENTVSNNLDLKDSSGDTRHDPRRFLLFIFQLQTQHNTESAADTLIEDLPTLLRSSSANGLFPGILNNQNEPLLYENELQRDEYWSIVFEIPYILWRCCSKPDFGLAADTTAFARSPTTSAAAEVTFDNTRMPSHLEMETPAFKEKLFSLSPAFFVPPVISSQERHGEAETEKEKAHASKECDGILLDMPNTHWSKKGLGHGIPIQRIRSYKAIEEVIDRGRSPQNCQKRLWVFFSPDPRRNEACLETVSARQKKNDGGMATFLRRHKCYDQFYSEDITRTLNRWKTEFHLVIYDLKPSEDGMNWIPWYLRKYVRSVVSFQFDGDFSGQYWTCHFLESNQSWGEGDELGLLSQHWDLPDVSREGRIERFAQVVRNLLRSGDAKSNDIRLGKNAWHQRRVLELILFGTAAEKLHTGAINIFEAAEQTFASTQRFENRSLEKERNHDVLFRKARHIQGALSNIQTVKMALDQNIEEINLWVKREDIRNKAGQKFSDDENHCLEILQDLESSNDHKILQIHRVRSRIEHLEQSMLRRLALMFGEMERRRADNIRQFTYVTIVFLPLGFATGVFSTSGAPASGTLKGMVFTAIVALAITALLLFYAKSVRKFYFWGSHWLNDKTRLRRMKMWWILYAWEGRFRRWIQRFIPSVSVERRMREPALEEFY